MMEYRWTFDETWHRLRVHHQPIRQLSSSYVIHVTIIPPREHALQHDVDCMMTQGQPMQAFQCESRNIDNIRRCSSNTRKHYTSQSVILML